MIPKYARYKYCIDKAIEFMFKEGINSFPFDSDNIINKNKWARLKYEFLANTHNVSIEDVIEAYGSKDGYSIYNGRNYTIAYNNTRIPKRIYFTKLHEIGHIYLNHFVEFDETILTRGNITDEKYKVLENEANCFARNIIAPAILVKELNLNTAEKISDYFQITLGCAKTRLDLLQDDLKYINKDSEKRQIKFFNNYLNKKLCSNCNNILQDTFCKICGNFQYEWGNEEMIYKGIELDENNKALICPKCSNEQFNNEGEFCKICGTYLINRCSNINGYETINDSIEPCGKLADGNARFCEFCGEKTTFYKNGFLSEWNEENLNVHVDDEEMPF